MNGGNLYEHNRTEIILPYGEAGGAPLFMDKKELTIEQELQNYLDKTYEKAVPAQVREYVESRMEQAPASQETQAAPAARERPARQNRRQREQAPAEPQTAAHQPDAPAEDSLQETQGMSMSM
jgi:septal ring factor EnvC (AmiA/AmiB activator)